MCLFVCVGRGGGGDNGGASIVYFQNTSSDLMTIMQLVYNMPDYNHVHDVHTMYIPCKYIHVYVLVLERGGGGNISRVLYCT